MDDYNVILIGFKNSGKTTIGRLLSFLLDKKFIDIDEIIKKIFSKKYKKKKQIYEIFKILAEKKFREMESEAFNSLKSIKDAIIATSGGSILNENNLSILKNLKKIIYLKTSKKVLKKRISKLKKTIFHDSDFFESTYDKREKIYNKLADIVIENNNHDFEKLALEIKKRLYV
jgi:shikimate kinase